MATPRLLVVAPGLIIASLCLAGCAGRDADDGEQRAGTAASSGLPVPEAGRGGVTGMPALPGPGAIGAPDPAWDRPPEALVDGDGNLVAPGIDAAADDRLSSATFDDIDDSGPQAVPDEPGAQEAVAVVRAYYTALDSASFARAYRLWSDGGVSTGQSPQQFADSFADTAAHLVEFMTPGRIDAAAGSRYIEVPVAVEVTRRDGAVQRLAGAYTLRRSVAEGASAEQRAWRIVSADLREVRP